MTPYPYLTRQQLEARRVQAVPMFQSGMTPAKVARAMNVSRTTASRWRIQLKESGSLSRRIAPGRPAKLKRMEELLPQLWAHRLKWTTAGFAEVVFQATGVRYDPDHMGRVIIRLGLREKRFRRSNQKAMEAVA